LSDIFPVKNGLKQGDDLLPLFLNLTLKYTIRWGSGKQDGLKLNGTHRLFFYADDVIILGGSVHTIKKSTDA